MKNIGLPKISLVIPTYNSSGYLEACLNSIYNQDYPKNKIETIVVDSIATTDNTEEIARRFPVKFIKNPKKLAEPAKTLGYKHCTGDLYLYLDSDAELVSKTWFKDMVRPLIEDSQLVGSATRYFSKASQSAFNRYMSFSPLQVPPMLDFLLPRFSDVVVEKRSHYDVIKVNPKKSPPMGMVLYRKDILDKVIKNPDSFNYVDIAIPIQLSELGYDRFAYVENAGYYHRRDTLYRELRRQKRDVGVTYLPVIGERKFHYVDFNNPLDLLKIIFWIIYANLIIPSIVVGIYKTILHRDWAGMYEVPATVLLTDYVLYLFLTEKNGKQLIRNIFLGKPVTAIKTHKLEKIFFVDKSK